MGPRANEALGRNQANDREPDETRVNIAMTAKILQFPHLKEDKDMEVGIETTNTTPATTKKKQARKEKTILAGAPLKERKPRAKKPPKADDAVRITPDLGRYKISKDVRTESGAPSIDINDKVARELRGLTLEQKYKAAAKELGETVAALEKRWSHLNPGQQAMCIANRLRAAAKKSKRRPNAARNVRLAASEKARAPTPSSGGPNEALDHRHCRSGRRGSRRMVDAGTLAQLQGRIRHCILAYMERQHPLAE
jgi:hypothetical protein